MIVLTLILKYIAGGKKTQQTFSSYSGKTMRVWDLYPYPQQDVIYIVFTDIDGLAMATAQPERNNLEYVTDDDIPIVWYFMDTEIGRQGKIIRDAIDEFKGKFKQVRIIWQPINGKKFTTFYKRDIMEVGDVMIRIKEKMRRENLDIRAGLAKSWYPPLTDNHDKAMCIARLNLALEVLCYYWLRARCVDLSKITMIPRKSKDGVMENVDDTERVDIRGYGEEKFVMRNYRDPRKFPMEISFFPARRSREIMRLTFKTYGLEPDWSKVVNSRDTNWRIETPAIYTDGKWQDLRVPDGADTLYLTVENRVKTRIEYEKTMNYEGVLPCIRLHEYPWVFLNIQSLNTRIPLATDLVKYTLSEDNRVLDSHIPRARRTEPTPTAKVGREGESSIQRIVTVESLNPRTPAMSRLGPKLNNQEIVSSSSRELVPYHSSRIVRDYDMVEETEANKSQDDVEELEEDPCPVEAMELGGRSPRRRDDIEPEPTKTPRRDESTPSRRSSKESDKSVEMGSQSEDSQDDTDEESVVSSSTDEETRKERRVVALLNFIDRYDEKEKARQNKKKKLKRLLKVQQLKVDRKKTSKK